MQNSIDNIGKISKFEYILMFLLICISGNPIFIYTNKYIYILSFIVLFLICIVKKVKLYSTKFILWFIGSGFLILLQNTTLELTSVDAGINFLVRLYIAFLSVSLFGERFREIYFKVMVFICAISIPMFVLQLLGVSFGINVDRYKSIIFYNSLNGDRNAGLFWEPGAFQGFIMLVLLLYYDKLKVLWKEHKKGCLILILALLTTKSTTAYLTFFIFILLTIFVSKRTGFMLKTVLLSLSVAIFVFVWSQDFMGEKIMKQYEDLQQMQVNDVYWDRLGVMVIDFHHTARHPLIGNGFVLNSRYGYLGEYMTGVGNGLSGAFNMFGVPFMLLYFIGLYRNLKYYSIPYRIIFIIIISLLLSGEYFLNYPFFWSLLFISLPQKKNYQQYIPQH